MIYMDNGATTKVSESVIKEMNRYYGEQYGNPSAGYRFGAEALRALNEARREIAARIGAGEQEIIFTSGGSEGNSLILSGSVNAKAFSGADGKNIDPERTDRSKGHIIISAVEHSSVLNAAKKLEAEGIEVSRAPVDETGTVRLDALKRLIRPDTMLISVMYANHEVGTVQPIEEIGRLAHENGILFHTDAVAAIGYEKIDVKGQEIDYLSASAHKFGGPKGVGFIYKRKNVPLCSQILGGAQEYGLRAGTENVPGIRGMMRAFCDRQDHMEEYQEALLEKQALFVRLLREAVPEVKIHGACGKIYSEDKSAMYGTLLRGLHGKPLRDLPGNIHFSIPGVKGERMVMYLDMEGICISTGSACNSRSHKPSPVLLALGLSEQERESSLRVTLSDENTEEEIRYVVDKIADYKNKF